MNVMRIEGSLLNFWVAKSAGLRLLPQPPSPGEKHEHDSGCWHPQTFHPSTDWSHGGPIVSNEWNVIEDVLAEWFGPDWTHAKAIMEHPLSWFMRAYVASQFGDQVEDMGSENRSLAPDPIALAQLQLNSRRAMRATQ